MQRPQSVAGPDGLLRCDCCGNGCLEIKRPYAVRDKNIEVPWLVESDETIPLSKSHCYAYQVQLQMFVSSRDYCDFAVRLPNSQHVETIVKDDIFFEL